MNLSEYAASRGIGYRAAWNRFKAGKIPGAWQDEAGRIRIPDETVGPDLNKAAIYARVSDAKQRGHLTSQQERVEAWAQANGYRIVESVKEVGSGVSDKRKGLASLLTRDTWGTLIVEHKDRLTRFGYRWFQLFIEQQGRQIVVINTARDDTSDLVEDLVAVIYSFSARLYGERRSERAQKMVQIAQAPPGTDSP